MDAITDKSYMDVIIDQSNYPGFYPKQTSEQLTVVKLMLTNLGSVHKSLNVGRLKVGA